MAISHVQRLDDSKQWRWTVLFIGLIFSYISVILFLFLIKKMEFTPFEKVKESYLQIDPFKAPIIIAIQKSISGKGVVVRLNTMCGSIIAPCPEFNYLVVSQNILGNLCAQDPSQVNFVVYIKYDKYKKTTQKRKIILSINCKRR